MNAMSLSQQAAQLNQSAEDVLAREGGPQASNLCPVANLALVSETMDETIWEALLDWPTYEPTLRQRFLMAGVPKARAVQMVSDLATPSFNQAVLAVRLVRLGANPVRLREMTLAEATEYLAGFLVKLI